MPDSQKQDEPNAKPAPVNRAYPAQVVLVCGKCGTELRISHPDHVSNSSAWVSEFLDRHLHERVELATWRGNIASEPPDPQAS